MSIAREELRIGGIPALALGEPSNQVYLYVHGQNGNKEEACGVAESLQRYGCQALSIDLPGHGERAGQRLSLSLTLGTSHWSWPR